MGRGAIASFAYWGASLTVACQGAVTDDQFADEATDASASGGAGDAPGGSGSVGNAGSGSTPAGGSGTAATEAYEFIPWQELENAGMGDALDASLVLRSVSSADGYENDDLLVTVATPEGNNRVLAISTLARTFRDHWPHFECGDCKAAATDGHSVVVAPSGVYASTDGGHRYWDLSPGSGHGDVSSEDFGVRVVEDQVWLWSSSVWYNAPLEKSQDLNLLPWDRGIFSVWNDTGIQRSADFVARRHAEEPNGPTDERTDNPCELPKDYYNFGFMAHEAERVVLACASAELAVSGDFPSTAFELWNLDGPALWLSTAFAATESHWYSTQREGPPVGALPPLDAGEQVYGYAISDGHGFRVSNLGVAASTFAPNAED